MALANDLNAIESLSTNGLAKRTATDTWTTITDNSANWDTAYSDRLKWDGGATGLVAATARTSLGLGALATLAAVGSTEITDGTITNADISTSAAIADSKLATISTAGKVSGSAITSGTIGGSAAIATSGAITTTGNIGIGSATPAAKLDVSGQIRSSTYTAAANATTFDFNNGNNQTSVQSAAGSGSIAITLSNMLDGGNYTIAMQSTQGGTYTFTATGVTTWKFLPTNGATVSAKDTLYTMTRLGSTVYVTWMSGF